MRTFGISPKLVAAALVAAITQAVTDPVLHLSSTWQVILQLVATAIAAYIAPPGDVAVDADEGANGADAAGTTVVGRPSR